MYRNINEVGALHPAPTPHLRPSSAQITPDPLIAQTVPINLRTPIIQIAQIVEKARLIDPFGHAGLTPLGEIRLTLAGEIKMTPVEASAGEFFFVVRPTWA